MNFIFRGFSILAIIAGTAYWLSYLPFDDSTLLRPIPPRADWISVHENAAQRVSEWGGNPFARSLLQASGVDMNEVDAIREDSTFLFLFHSLAGRETVLAHIPKQFSMNRPSWVLTSWLGGRATWFRWYLHLRPDVSLVHQGEHLGYDIWMIDPGGGYQPPVYFALCRGMLMASIDGSPELLKGMIQLTLSQVRFWDSVQLQLQPEALCGGSGAADRAWLDGAYWGMEDGLRIALEDVDGYVLRGRACSTETLPGFDALPDSWVQTALHQFRSEETLAWTMMPFQALWERLESAWLKEAFMLPETLQTQPIWLSLQAGDLGGRFLGVNVPSVALALEVESQEQADIWVGHVLDVLNARFGWGLIPKKILLDGREVTLIEPSSNSAYGFLPNANKVGYCVNQGWLTVASYAGILDPVVGSSDPKTHPLPQAVFGGSGGLYTGVRLEALSEQLSPLIRILQFRLMLKRSVDREAQRERLELAHMWLDVLRPFGEAFFSLYTEDNSTILTIQAGRL